MRSPETYVMFPFWSTFAKNKRENYYRENEKTNSLLWENRKTLLMNMRSSINMKAGFNILRQLKVESWLTEGIESLIGKKQMIF